MARNVELLWWFQVGKKGAVLYGGGEQNHASRASEFLFTYSSTLDSSTFGNYDQQLDNTWVFAGNPHKFLKSDLVDLKREVVVGTTNFTN